MYYENFDNLEELGFLCYGENLEYGLLEKLVKSLVKDVIILLIDLNYISSKNNQNKY